VNSLTDLASSKTYQAASSVPFITTYSKGFFFVCVYITLSSSYLQKIEIIIGSINFRFSPNKPSQDFSSLIQKELQKSKRIGINARYTL